MLSCKRRLLRRFGRALVNPSKMIMGSQRSASAQPGSRTEQNTRKRKTHRCFRAEFELRRQKPKCMLRLAVTSLSRENSSSSFGRLLPADERLKGAFQRGRDHVRRRFACSTSAFVVSVLDFSRLTNETMSIRYQVCCFCTNHVGLRVLLHVNVHILTQMIESTYCGHMDASQLETFMCDVVRNTCTRLACHDGWQFFSVRHKMVRHCVDAICRVVSDVPGGCRQPGNEIEFNQLRTVVCAMQKDRRLIEILHIRNTRMRLCSWRHRLVATLERSIPQLR